MKILVFGIPKKRILPQKLAWLHCAFLSLAYTNARPMDIHMVIPSLSQSRKGMPVVTAACLAAKK
jgi:hypothetical protein